MKEFIWTDELVKEFTLGAMRVQEKLPNEISLEKGLYHFKKEKQSKPIPEYEILSVQRDNDIFTRSGDMFYAKDRHAWRADTILSKSNNPLILSVKRLTDGEIFNIDDDTNHGKITGFDILGFTRMHVYTLPQNATELKDISKAPERIPEPDPVKIFDGYLDGKAVREHKGQLYIKYDGRKLDTLNINITLTSQEECKELIKALEIHKFCFPRKII